MFIATLLLAAAVASAQEEPEFNRTPESEELPKKEPSFFRRPAKETPEEQLAYADSLRAAGRLARAGKQYRALVHGWHGAVQAARAQQSYAEVLDQRGKTRKAFDEYQYLVRYFGGEFLYTNVLDRQFAIARETMTGRHGGVWFFPGFTTPERALPLFEKIVENAPAWDRAPEARFYIGAIQEGQKEYDLAATAYETLRLRHPQHDLVAEADFRRALCLCRLADEAPRDEEACRRALSALASCVADHPADLNTGEAGQHLDAQRERLVRMAYERAAFYDRKRGKPQAALVAYDGFVRTFPSGELAERARERIAALKAQTAEGSPP